jgi:hypothetical protein
MCAVHHDPVRKNSADIAEGSAGAHAEICRLAWCKFPNLIELCWNHREQDQEGAVMRNDSFGRFLKAGIGSIAMCEGKTAPAIKDELGERIGVSAATIQRYKTGYLPHESRTIQLLAEAAVKRGYLNREWRRCSQRNCTASSKPDCFGAPPQMLSPLQVLPRAIKSPFCN